MIVVDHGVRIKLVSPRLWLAGVQIAQAEHAESGLSVSRQVIGRDLTTADQADTRVVVTGPRRTILNGVVIHFSRDQRRQLLISVSRIAVAPIASSFSITPITWLRLTMTRTAHQSASSNELTVGE